MTLHETAVSGCAYQLDHGADRPVDCGDPTGNFFLDSLTSSEQILLLTHLRPTHAARGTLLVEAGKPLEFLYFPVNGVATLIARSPAGLQVEAGMIGRESLVYPAAILGIDPAPIEVRALTDCHAHRMPCAPFLAALERSPMLHRRVMDHTRAQLSQLAFSYLSFATCNTTTRMARWLLMVHDRCGSDSIAITHRTLADMLAVRRPTVTQGLHLLEGEGLIRSKRSIIRIRNRAALETFAAKAYTAETLCTVG